MKKYLVWLSITCIILIKVIDWSASTKLNYLPDQAVEITVAGEVRNPGRVTVFLPLSFQELLTYFELNESADISGFNPLMPVKANDYFFIPAKGHQLISINYASYEQLLQVKGLGPVLVTRIIEYRECHGLFQAVSDLMLIKGIKQTTWAKIAPFLCL